jgi:hypothetical protein
MCSITYLQPSDQVLGSPGNLSHAHAYGIPRAEKICRKERLPEAISPPTPPPWHESYGPFCNPSRRASPNPVFSKSRSSRILNLIIFQVLQSRMVDALDEDLSPWEFEDHVVNFRDPMMLQIDWRKSTIQSSLSINLFLWKLWIFFSFQFWVHCCLASPFGPVNFRDVSCSGWSAVQMAVKRR